MSEKLHFKSDQVNAGKDSIIAITILLLADIQSILIFKSICLFDSLNTLIELNQS